MQRYDFGHIFLEVTMSCNGNKTKHINEIHRINYLGAELESLYHQSSVKLGITDSVSMVLYAIYDEGGECLLSDIYKNSGISKQTINSAIRNLEAQDILYLRQHSGRSKMAILTEKGKAFAENTVAKICRAESDAFNSWTEEEITTYLQLMEKYIDCFRQQIDKI